MKAQAPLSDTRTRSFTSRFALLVIAALLSAIFVGCSNSDTEADASSTSSTEQDTTSDTPDDSSANEVEPGPGGDTPETTPTAPAPPGTSPTPTAPTPPARPGATTPPARPTTPTNPPPPSSPPQPPATQPSATGISIDQAVQIAVGKYGGTVVEVEADSYRGTPTWEIELVNSSLGRIEVHVSRSTGEILKVEDENDDD